MNTESLLGVRIKIPPEAVVPLLIGIAALVTLLFFGSKLAEWKQRSPAAASKFGVVAAVLFTGVAIFFLIRCLANQSDPNNEGTGQLSFIDPPVAGFMAALATAFWRMGNQRALTFITGLGIGGLMLAKPFIWPVIRVWSAGELGRSAGSRPRDLIDPEHLVFLGAGVVVIVTALIAGKKRT